MNSSIEYGPKSLQQNRRAWSDDSRAIGASCDTSKDALGWSCSAVVSKRIGLGPVRSPKSVDVDTNAHAVALNESGTMLPHEIDRGPLSSASRIISKEVSYGD